MKCYLITPPTMIPEQPPISTAVLKSYLLCKTSYCVETIDLSLDFFYYLIERIKVDKEFDNTTVLGLKIAALDYLNNTLKFDLNSFAYNTVSSKNEVSHWAAPMPFSYSELLPFLETAPDSLDSFLGDGNKNIYVSYIERIIISKRNQLRNEDFFGFSIIGFFQVIPALTIAKCLKKHFPDCKICFGGPWVTLYIDKIPDLFSSVISNYIDFFSYAEGEESIEKILAYLQGECDVDSVPNTLIKNDGYYISTNLFSIFNMNSYSSPPDYIDFQLEKYLSFIEGEGRISVQSSRGCYHNKCSFCNALTNLQCKKLRQKGIDEFVSEIEILIERHPNVKVYDFADSVSSKRRLMLLSNLFMKNNLSWEIDIRLEKWVDDELIEKVKQSKGLLRFGLESVSQRLLDLHQKGNDMNVINTIMERCKHHNYKPLIMTIVGLPSETIDEALQLKDFFIHYINYCYPLVEDFNLERNTDIYFNPEKYSIEIDYSTSILSPHLSFTRKAGYSDDEANEIYKKVFMDVMHAFYSNQIVGFDYFNWQTVNFCFTVNEMMDYKICGKYNGIDFQSLNPHFKQALYSYNMFLKDDAAVIFS